MTPPFRIAALGVVIIAACTSGVILPPEGAPVTGDWGGDHIRMTLTQTGGQIEYDCARGVVSGPLLADANGAFVVMGFHFRGHGGPVRIDEPVDSVSARYSGTIRDNVMKLDVGLPSDNLGPYTLAKGGAARVFRCL